MRSRILVEGRVVEMRGQEKGETGEREKERKEKSLEANLVVKRAGYQQAIYPYS